MSPYLLIDGYNVMYAAGYGRAEYHAGDLQRGREHLLKHLSSRMTVAEVQRSLVVFDARDPPVGRPARSVLFGLSIVFALPTGDADEMLTELMQSSMRSQALTLVSGDRALQRAARSRRAKWLDSHEFLRQIDQRRHPLETAAPAEPSGKFQGLSQAEVAHWVGAFGPIVIPDDQLQIPDVATRRTTPVVPRPSESAPAKRSSAKRPSAKRKAVSRRARLEPPQELTDAAGCGDLQFWLSVFGRIRPEALGSD